MHLVDELRIRVGGFQTSRSVDSHPSFRIFASPTSAILAVQSRPSSTLALFRSKCTILHAMTWSVYGTRNFHMTLKVGLLQLFWHSSS